MFVRVCKELFSRVETKAVLNREKSLWFVFEIEYW